MIIHIEKENQDLPLYLCYQDYNGEFHPLVVTADGLTSNVINYLRIQELPRGCVAITALTKHNSVPDLSIAINVPMQNEGFLSRNLYVVVPPNHGVSSNDNYILSVRVK